MVSNDSIQYFIMQLAASPSDHTNDHVHPLASKLSFLDDAKEETLLVIDNTTCPTTSDWLDIASGLCCVEKNISDG